MMTRILACILCLGSLSLQAAESKKTPNVIFVMADDLGIGDLQPTNPDCKIKTPHLLKMAQEGITFLDASSEERREGIDYKLRCCVYHLKAHDIELLNDASSIDNFENTNKVRYQT